MKFIDKLLLGNLPPSAETSTFPSSTYRHTKCYKKHCTESCYKHPTMDWEFWAFFLSEREVQKATLLRKMKTLHDDLRLSVWYKLLGARDVCVRMNVQVGVERCDRKLVDFILSMCRTRDSNEVLGGESVEKSIFLVYRNVYDVFYANGRRNCFEKQLEDYKFNDTRSEDIYGRQKDRFNTDRQKDRFNTDRQSNGNIIDRQSNNNIIDRKNDENFYDRISVNSSNYQSPSKNSIKTKIKKFESNNENLDLYKINDLKESSNAYNTNLSTSYNIYTDDFVDEELIYLIDFFLSKENSNLIIVYKIIYILFKRMGFDKIFTLCIERKNELVRSLSDDYYELLLENTNFEFIKMFIKVVIENEPTLLDNIFDLAFCFSASSFCEIIGAFIAKNENEIINKINKYKLKKNKEDITERDREKYKDKLKNSYNEDTINDNKKDARNDSKELTIVDSIKEKIKEHSEKNTNKNNKLLNEQESIKKDKNSFDVSIKIYEKDKESIMGSNVQNMNADEEISNKKNNSNETNGNKTNGNKNDGSKNNDTNKSELNIEDEQTKSMHKNNLNADIANILYKYIKENTFAKLDEIKKNLKLQKINAIEIEEENNKKEEYFDFLVIQNEAVKAQECLKSDLVRKIEELSKENETLMLQTINLKENVQIMESEFKDFNEIYVKEIKKMLNDAISVNENLLIENEKIKNQNKN